MTESTQRRIRVSYDGKITIKTDTTTIHSGKCRNISLNGVFVETTSFLPINTHCRINMQLSGTNPDLILSMTGHIVRIDHDGMAITFEQLMDDTFEHLKKIVLYNTDDPEQFLHQCDERKGFK